MCCDLYTALQDTFPISPGAGERGWRDVPETVIRRRFVVGMQNFQRHYRAAVNDWAVYDNTGKMPIILERGENR